MGDLEPAEDGNAADGISSTERVPGEEQAPPPPPPPPASRPRKTSWDKARAVRHAADAVRQFRTLHEVVDITRRMDFSDYTFVKNLGHGAFGEVSEFQVGT